MTLSTAEVFQKITHERFERFMCGAVLKNPDSIVDLLAVTRPADCYFLRTQYVFEAAESLFARRVKPDVQNVADELEKMERFEDVGGMPFLTGLLLEPYDVSQIEHYGRRVAEKAYIRRMVNAAHEIIADGLGATNVDDFRGKVESRLAQAEGDSINDDAPATLSELLDDYADFIEISKNEDESTVTGLPTGFADLDDLLDGIQENELVILAARPGMGKSALATCIALNLAKYLLSPDLPDMFQKLRGGVIYIASMEMNRAQVRERLQAQHSEVPNYQIRRGLRPGGMGQKEWRDFVKSEKELGDLKIIIDDKRGLTPRELEARVRRASRRHGPIALLIVDYLQLMRPGVKVGTKEEGVAYISSCLKTMAAQYRILALSQLNRSLESREDKRPMLSDLRDSGALEQDAGTVVFIYRDVEYNPDTTMPNAAELIVAKNRYNKTGVVYAHWQKHITKFTDGKVTTVDLREL